GDVPRAIGVERPGGTRRADWPPLGPQCLGHIWPGALCCSCRSTVGCGFALCPPLAGADRTDPRSLSNARSLVRRLEHRAREAAQRTDISRLHLRCACLAPVAVIG